MTGEEIALLYRHPASLAGFLAGNRFDRPAHIEHLSESASRSVLRGGGRLIVTMPPRHGKSTLCSSWLPYWFLCLFPYRSVMLVSYGATFAERWGRRVRRMASAYADDHPRALSISQDSRSAGEWETDQGGGMKCLGIGGDATGRGADLLIIDDPVKNSEEARSEVMRAKTWEFWQETLRTRIEPGGTVLVIQTRWHEDDLAGRLLDGDDDEMRVWDHIDFPAINDDGEALWPDRFGVDALEDIRRDVGSYAWNALYQQRPTPEGGGMFRRKDFRYFRDGGEHYELLSPEGKAYRVLKSECRVFQTVDTAMTEKQTSDYMVILTYALTPMNHLLVLDVDRDRLEIPDQWPRVRSAIDRAKRLPGYRWTAVEDKGSGIGMIQLARKLGQPLRALKADRDKVTRATPASVWYENGMVYHNEGASWLADFEHELMSFPNGAHDDQVDTIAYAVSESRARPPEPITTDGRPIEAPGRGIFSDFTSGRRSDRSMWRQ